MDPALGAFIISVLTLLLRELRWHRVHGEQGKQLQKVHEEVQSLRPKAKPKMPPWDEVDG